MEQDNTQLQRDVAPQIENMPEEDVESLKRLARITVRNDEQCSICLDTLHNACITSCKHIFGADCLQKTIKHLGTRCPICRAKFEGHCILRIVGTLRAGDLVTLPSIAIGPIPGVKWDGPAKVWAVLEDLGNNIFKLGAEYNIEEDERQGQEPATQMFTILRPLCCCDDIETCQCFSAQKKALIDQCYWEQYRQRKKSRASDAEAIGRSEKLHRINLCPPQEENDIPYDTEHSSA